jgi:hypothetical protein
MPENETAKPDICRKNAGSIATFFSPARSGLAAIAGGDLSPVWQADPSEDHS